MVSYRFSLEKIHSIIYIHSQNLPADMTRFGKFDLVFRSIHFGAASWGYTMFFPECVATVPVSLCGGVGVELCSPDVAFTFATVRNRPQPFATSVRVRSVWPCLQEVLQKRSLLKFSSVAQLHFAWQAWHFVTFQHVSWRVKESFCVAGAALWTLPMSFCVAGAAL